MQKFIFDSKITNFIKSNSESNGIYKSALLKAKEKYNCLFELYDFS